MTTEPTAPLGALHAAVRDRLPHVAVSHVPPFGHHDPHLSLSYRNAGPWRIYWDDGTYVREVGLSDRDVLGSDPVKAAEQLAVALEPYGGSR